MKRSLMIVAVTIATVNCSGVSAAPLMDYSAGKTAIDLNYRGSDFEYENSTSNNLSFDRKSNVDWGITTGLGNKFAIQYNGYNAKSPDKSIFDAGLGIFNTVNIELKIQEFNVLYQINENVSAYTGIIKSKLVGGFNGASISTNEKSAMQFGLIGSTKIGNKTTAYASFAVAPDVTNWKIGVSQEIAPNLDFNIDYRCIEVKKITTPNYNGSDDLKTKGLGYGVTYKF